MKKAKNVLETKWKLKMIQHILYTLLILLMKWIYMNNFQV